MEDQKAACKDLMPLDLTLLAHGECYGTWLKLPLHPFTSLTWAMWLKAWEIL